VPFITIDEKNDDLFNKGMKFLCPKQFKKEFAKGIENYETYSNLLDKSLKPDLDRDFPVE